MALSVAQNTSTSSTSAENLLRAALGNGTFIISTLFIILYVVYAIWQPSALSVSDITDFLNNALPLAIAAAGGTFVVLTRGFDLSVAGIISIANVVMATKIGEGPGQALLGLGLVCAIGLACGATNGFLVSKIGLQSIASSLGTMIITSGIALVLLDAPGGTVSEFVSYGLMDDIAGVVPITGLIAAALILLWLVVKRTDIGIAIYAVGADETASTLAGINVVKTRFFAYSIAGLLYGLAGYMLSAQTATGNPNAGNPFLLQVFAAIAIGGTSFRGGRGGVVGSMVGAATLMLLQKLLFAAGVSSFYTGLFQGVIMIVAVLVAALSSRFSRAGVR
jgi:ribose transport system permease protein